MSKKLLLFTNIILLLLMVASASALTNSEVVNYYKFEENNSLNNDDIVDSMNNNDLHLLTGSEPVIAPAGIIDLGFEGLPADSIYAYSDDNDFLETVENNSITFSFWFQKVGGTIFQKYESTPLGFVAYKEGKTNNLKFSVWDSNGEYTVLSTSL